MNYLRQTVDSNILADVLDLPLSLRNRPVEVIVLPLEKITATAEIKKQSAFGCLKKYADVAKIPREKIAWTQAAAEKHGNS